MWSLYVEYLNFLHVSETLYEKKTHIQVIHIVFIRGALKDLVIIFISINRTKLKKTLNLINKKLLITS